VAIDMTASSHIWAEQRYALFADCELSPRIE
jgi:phage gp37-like protein